MGFIENILNVRKMEQLRMQNELGRKRLAEDAKKREKQEREELNFNKRRIALGYLNKSVVPQLFFEIKEKLEPAATIVIEGEAEAIRSWPMNEKQTEEIIRRDRFYGDDLTIALHWNYSGGSPYDYRYYNSISVTYEPNGEAIFYYGYDKKRLRLDKWINKPDVQKRIIEYAFLHPRRNSISPPTIDHCECSQ